MKMLLKRLFAATLFCCLFQFSPAQVMNPADPVIEYTGGFVAQPPYGQVGDWVKTTRLNWNTEDYRCYIYKGNVFRLKFPKTYQHNVNDGKVYPVFIFFHGLGESGDENIYDNEYQLFHGGQLHKDSVNSGKFDGFLLYPQNEYGFFGPAQYDALAELIQNFLVPQNKADINRIFVNGLSAGGTACWEFTIRYPNLVAGCLPISAANSTFQSSANTLKYIPIWHFQGGLDKNPSPATSQALGNAILAVGGSYKRTVYPNRGHGCWYDAWGEKDYFPFMNRTHKANPVPLFGKYEFCVGETVNVTLGLSPGFAAYEWRKDGVTIAGATSNTYTVTSFGTYSCRFRRGTVWSPWSPTPIVVKLKDPTVPPAIQTKGLMSKVIPAPDGNTGVTLMEPTGYQTYSWTRVGNATVLSTVDTFRATSPGSYVVKLTEQFGCLSEFSQPFTVVDANGPNKPDMPGNVMLSPLSLTQMKIDWSDNPNSAFNETNFEVYQATQSGGPYTLVGITNQDITTFTVNGLNQNTRYYYKLRAVNNTGASAATEEVSSKTVADTQAPTAPGNLRVTAATNNSVSLAWNASTDNVGVDKYDIYINGVKSFVTSATSFSCYNLTTADSGYLFIVKARDAAGNVSNPSNNVYGIPPILVPPVPGAPTNVTATAVSHKRINISWTDNSSNETGFEVLRSTNPIAGYFAIGTTEANGTTYADSIGLNASTTYYYQVRSVYGYGGSPLNVEPQASWKLNNSYTDASINNKQLLAGGAVFDAANKMEGTHSLRFDGNGQYTHVTTATNDYLRGGYSSKTVSFWMRSNNNLGNRVVFDLGGSDDGLAVRLDALTLYAGIASNNTRRSISTLFPSTGWNHIALVYNVNTFRLYVNGLEVASNLNLGFTAVGTTTNESRLGGVNGTNSFNTGTGYFNGWLDQFEIFDVPLSQADIVKRMNNSAVTVTATTLATPALPAVPSGLTATGISSSSNSITWVDNAASESGFRLYKSDDDNLNYVLLATLPANATSYTDAGLFANAIRYYKVTVFNADGESGPSNEDSARTLQPLPVVSPVGDKVMRYGTQLNVPVQANSPLNSIINFSFQNLPAFASFTPGANGTGVLSFTNPAQAQQGTYAGIVVTATDSYGSSSTSFQLTVNDNYDPVLPVISNVSLNEKQTAQVDITATDPNAADILNWSFTGLPAFVSTTINGNTAQLNYAPGYADHGDYQVTATVTDGNSGSASRTFSIHINDVSPTRKIYLNFTDGSIATPAPWNATNKQPALNDNFPNLKDDAGVTTPIGFRILSPWGNIGNGSNVLGVNTGNNSGIYPDAVIRSAYWTDASVQNMSVYGLDITKKYTFTFFGSRGGVVDNRTSLYTVKGLTATLNAAGNSQNTVSIPAIQPEADGTLAMSLARNAGSNFGYLNALVIDEVFDDSTAPAKPRNLTAQLAGSTAQLTWIDAAYNEVAYEVYRSANLAGPYTLINPGGNNVNLQAYNDGGLAGNQHYYYTVRAVNSYGNSPFSDTADVLTGNGAPVMATIPNVTMRIQETQNVNVAVTDDLGDVTTLTASNLPSFATLVDNGDGTGVIQINPGNSIGIYNNVTITATDDHGASASRSFRIVVRDVFNSVYVNFSNTPSLAGPSPWNNFNSVPFAGKVLTNMIDDSETPTGISITQVDTWEGANDLGASTGNNSGVYPDNVMKSVYYQSSTVPMRLRVAGLNPVNTKYNLVFFASRQAGDDRSTSYTANGQTVTLNAANNINNTVQLNGLVADAGGVIEFSCLKTGTSPYAYLGAVVIQSYVDDGTPFAPSNLVATAVSKTAIRLNWSDKSSDEDGFEIQRAESFNGPYTLINTTAANVSTYTDGTGLQAGKVYYYKVRGVRTGVYSAFTNVASTSTFMYSVYINFNRQNNAAAPWNNTSRAPEQGRVFSNLRNDLSNSSGLNMTVVDNFSGDNPSGMNTGNNSGVWPDNVLRSSWWVDVGVVSTLKISNLNQNMAYSFVFSGSRNGGGDRTCIYTINGKSVSLNASFNTTQVVQIDNVKPDQNGEVLVTVSLGQYAAFAYLNGMIINGYKLGTQSGSGFTGRGAVPDYVQEGNQPPVPVVTTVAAPNNNATVSRNPVNSEVSGEVAVYPNPFTDAINVSLYVTGENEKVLIRLIDMSGKQVFIREFAGLQQGDWKQQLTIPGEQLAPGVYLLEVSGADKKLPPKIFKLVKNR
ncbi:MAG: T9SS type A sorting domain-containing protein [Sphingobacteriales bacterium]|nr:T9SS type A sorting domain-containing protein [Sphingobacteriales bacterium]